MGRKKTSTVPCEEIQFSVEETEELQVYDNILNNEGVRAKAKTFDHNGIELFMAFGKIDQIYEFSIADVIRNFDILRDEDKYKDLLEVFTFNLLRDIKNLCQNDKIHSFDRNKYLLTPTISYEETAIIINKLSKEQQSLMFSLVKDYRRLNAEYYEEQKTYSIAI